MVFRNRPRPAAGGFNYGWQAVKKKFRFGKFARATRAACSRGVLIAGASSRRPNAGKSADQLAKSVPARLEIPELIE
jgi:hypothetical protein